MSESETVKISNENTDEFVECDYEMLMCVNELERERKNNVVVEWGPVSYTHLDVYKRQSESNEDCENSMRLGVYCMIMMCRYVYIV